MAQPMMRWVNVSLSSRLFIVFSVSSVSLCPLCLNKNPSTRRLRSCMTSSHAVGRCVRHRGHRDTEDTEEFRDFASTTLPTTDGRICCLAITAGAPRSARGLFVYTLSAGDRRERDLDAARGDRQRAGAQAESLGRL